MEVKIDKRTKAYRDSIEKARPFHPADFGPIEECDGLLIEEVPGYKFTPCTTCGGSGKGEGCMEQGGPVFGLCPSCCGHKGTMDKVDSDPDIPVDKVVFETVSDFMVCSEIGCTNRHPEDETFRTRPEPCYACVMRNY